MIKVADFGTSTIVGYGRSEVAFDDVDVSLTRNVGTPLYMAPEVCVSVGRSIRCMAF